MVLNRCCKNGRFWDICVWSLENAIHNRSWQTGCNFYPARCYAPGAHNSTLSAIRIINITMRANWLQKGDTCVGGQNLALWRQVCWPGCWVLKMWQVRWQEFMEYSNLHIFAQPSTICHLYLTHWCGKSLHKSCCYLQNIMFPSTKRTYSQIAFS